MMSGARASRSAERHRRRPPGRRVGGYTLACYTPRPIGARMVITFGRGERGRPGRIDVVRDGVNQVRRRPELVAAHRDELIEAETLTNSFHIVELSRWE